MTTVISPNIHKESDRIDPQGNIINPKTKQVIQSNEPEYIPTQEEINKSVAPQPVSKIDELINKKIEEIINQKVAEALSKL